MPNYTVHPPDGLDIHGTPHVVDQATRLNELIQQSMGDVDLATCTYDPSAPTNKVYDVHGVIDESTGTVTKYSKDDPAEPGAPTKDDSEPSTGRRSEPVADNEDAGPHDDGPVDRGDHGDRTPWQERELASDQSAAMRELWDGLTPEERRDLYAHDPMFGERAALPVEVCDTYARQAALDLRSALIDDINMRSNINQGNPMVTHSELNQLRFYDNLLDSVSHRPDDTPRFLLGFDHDFRSITAVGNPDSAARTVVFVPGTFTTHDTLNPHLERPGLKNWFGLTERFEKPGYMEVCRRMYASIDDQRGNMGDVAVIDYQNYHAPQSLAPGAARALYAEAGAPSLRDHLERLQHTNHVVDNKIWMAGHSYGTTLVGEAAHGGRGLSADGIINLGSPGLRVADVSGLMLHGQHLVVGDAPVHTMTRTDDPINVVDLARKTGLHRFDVGHGLMPHHPEFGGHVWNVDGGAPRDRHNAYFDTGNVALEYIARVVAGEVPPHVGESQPVPGRVVPRSWYLLGLGLVGLLGGDAPWDEDEQGRSVDGER